MPDGVQNGPPPRLDRDPVRFSYELNPKRQPIEADAKEDEKAEDLCEHGGIVSGVAGRCAIPRTAKALSINTTVLNGTAAGELVLTIVSKRLQSKE
jgi:hypothetical protein